MQYWLNYYQNIKSINVSSWFSETLVREYRNPYLVWEASTLTFLKMKNSDFFGAAERQFMNLNKIILQNNHQRYRLRLKKGIWLYSATQKMPLWRRLPVKVYLFFSSIGSHDLSVIELESLWTKGMYIFLAYMAHERSTPPKELLYFVSFIKAGKANHLIDCDVKARYTLCWTAYF